MALYQITKESFRPINQATFSELKLKERDDLQRLLRTQIEVLDENLFVLSEEFSDWEDSKRRIDLLAIDKEANLIVIELKRTADGGHMELQAIRYASMISSMTFDRAVKIHQSFLDQFGNNEQNAEKLLLGFLGWSEPDEENFGTDVRILLVSEDFGKELTTAVLWLREKDVDISCIRMKPFKDGATGYMDVQQIIPLPEAHEYQVKLKQKEQKGKATRAKRYDERLRFWEGLVSIVRERKTRHANLKPGTYHWLGASSGIRGLGFNYLIAMEHGIVELYIDRGDGQENTTIFNEIHVKKLEIEARFGSKLSWEPLEGKRACRIKHTLDVGGYRSPQEEWPVIQLAMVDAMIKLEAALRPELDKLSL